MLGILLASMVAQPDGGGIALRVAILHNAPEVVLTGDLSVNTGGDKWKSKRKIKISSRKNRIKIDGGLVKGPVRIRSSKDEIKIGKSSYRGEMYIHATGQGLLVVDHLPAEQYLVGLINAESYSYWPREAIRAQAVVARTYALHRRSINAGKKYDVRSTVLDQCYHGSALEDDEAADAVSSTRGQVLYFGGRIAETFYHSTCGGTTAGAGEVWGFNRDYLRSVKCEWCSESPRYFWKYRADAGQIARALSNNGIKIGRPKKIVVENKTSSGRNSVVKVSGSIAARSVKATDFRKALGYTNIFSTRFEIFEPEKGVFLFLGRGSGHGVGMCQWGAKGMAADGKKYVDILNFYYYGCSIVQAY